MAYPIVKMSLRPQSKRSGCLWSSRSGIKSWGSRGNLCCVAWLYGVKKLEVSLCPMRRNKVMLVWKASRPHHTTVEVPMAYTAEVVVSSRVQKSTQLFDSVYEVSTLLN